MPLGRPTKYKKEYCEQIIAFFSRKPYKEKEIQHKNKDGDTYKTEYVKEANDIPFISEFAREIGVCHDTILEWANRHKDFSLALKKAKELQKEFLIKNGLAGLYNPTFAIFTAKNITDMRDVSNVEVEDKKAFGVIIRPELLKIEAGRNYREVLPDEKKKEALPEGRGDMEATT